MKTLEERQVDFLIGLAALTRATGLIVSGCGCCGSPRLEEVESAALADEAGYGYGHRDEVAWISRADPVDWDEFSDSIVRQPVVMSDGDDHG